MGGGVELVEEDLVSSEECVGVRNLCVISFVANCRIVK